LTLIKAAYEPYGKSDVPSFVERSCRYRNGARYYSQALEKKDRIMKRHLRFLAAALISAVNLGADVALAQPVQQQMPMMGSGNGCTMMQGMMGPGAMMNFGPMMEGRLAYIKAELGVTEAQTSAWNDYASAVKARGTAMQDMHTAMAQTTETGSALERLDAHIKTMESMVESLKALRPATETLYKVLSTDQKKKADLLLGMGGCMM
jgi:LTXXQ motif family protein